MSESKSVSTIAVSDINLLRSRLASQLLSAEHEMIELGLALEGKKKDVEQYRGGLQAIDIALKITPFQPPKPEEAKASTDPKKN
jgi:hypothetical protein